MVVTDTLHVAGLLRNHRIARSLSEAALGRLVGMVRYKAEKLGGLALGAPPFLMSSGRCSACGAANATLALGERSWTCPACEAALDRDGDAADNLRRLGLTVVADGPVPEELRTWGELDRGRARLRGGVARGPRALRRRRQGRLAPK